jgi:DNA-binding transcriptional LysR family regulator
MLNVQRLRVLCAVARLRSFSAAAEELNYTQSAISQQIAALEREVGVALLERRARAVMPTVAGEALIAHAEGILARLAAAQEELQAIAGLRGGSLRLASFASAGGTLLPEAIARFRARYPAVELALVEGEPEQIAPRLAAGEIDLALLFAFAEGPRARTAQQSRLRRIHLLSDPMYLALPREHPLAERPTLRLGDLSEESWIQTSRASACAGYVVRACHRAGFEPRVSFESDDYLTVQGLVAAGVGVALIPRLALANQRRDIVVRSLAPRNPLREVFAATPLEGRAAPAAPAMLQLLATVASEYSTQSGAGAKAPGADAPPRSPTD